MEQTMTMVADKRPAHEVVLGLIEKTSKDLYAAQGTPSRCKLAGALSASIDVLGGMKIPRDIVPVVVGRLTKIHQEYPTEVLLLPDVITAVQANLINPITAFITNGGDFSSAEGAQLVTNYWITPSDQNLVLEAIQEDRKILTKLLEAYNTRSGDPHFRRTVVMITEKVPPQ